MGHGLVDRYRSVVGEEIESLKGGKLPKKDLKRATERVRRKQTYKIYILATLLIHTHHHK
jgi:hypothetical protein